MIVTNKAELIHKTRELMKDFKEMTGTTRKYAVPLLEYFDKIKFTFRTDDGRKLIR